MTIYSVNQVSASVACCAALPSVDKCARFLPEEPRVCTRLLLTACPSRRFAVRLWPFCGQMKRGEALLHVNAIRFTARIEDLSSRLHISEIKISEYASVGKLGDLFREKKGKLLVLLDVVEQYLRVPKTGKQFPLIPKNVLLKAYRLLYRIDWSRCAQGAKIRITAKKHEKQKKFTFLGQVKEDRCRLFRIFLSDSHVIGSGGHSTVYRCHQVDRGCWRAFKLAKKKSGKAMEAELSNLRALHRKQKSAAPSGLQPFPLLDYSRGYIMARYSGDLCTLMEMRQISHENLEGIAKDIIKAFCFACNRGIYHSDLKQENILIREDASGKLSGCVIDWGCICRVEYVKSAREHGRKLSLVFTADCSQRAEKEKLDNLLNDGTLLALETALKAYSTFLLGVLLVELVTNQREEMVFSRHKGKYRWISSIAPHTVEVLQSFGLKEEVAERIYWMLGLEGFRLPLDKIEEMAEMCWFEKA